jgi:hypothetical protein
LSALYVLSVTSAVGTPSEKSYFADGLRQGTTSQVAEKLAIASASYQGATSVAP